MEVAHRYSPRYQISGVALGARLGGGHGADADRVIAAGDQLLERAADPGERPFDDRDAVVHGVLHAGELLAPPGVLDANSRARSSWPAASTLTPKRRCSRTTRSVRAPLAKQTSASSGSSESEQTAFAVMPDRAVGAARRHDRDAGGEMAHHVAEALGLDGLHQPTVSVPYMPSSSWLASTQYIV